MRMLVWGTGRLVGKVVGRYIDIKDITAFIDNDVNKKEYMGRKVLCPEEAAKTEYDAIIVANLFQKEIREQCQLLGIDLNKVIFLYNNCVLKDVNEDYDFVERILGKEHAEVVKNRYHVVRGVEAYSELCLKTCGGGISRAIMCVSSVLNWQ